MAADINKNDELTGLLTQEQFMFMLDRAISRAKRQKNMLALMYLDLDNFKLINEMHGEAVGDEVLKKIAVTLSHNLRKEEYIARVGGDEFVVLVEDIKDIAHVDTIARKIQKVFTIPVQAAEKKLLVNFCMGIAMFPVAGETAEVLLRHADMALYTAKASGKDRFRYFSQDFNQQSERHLQVAACLQTAMRDKEFYLSYKPVYDLHSNKLVSVEAELNWCSNEYGDIPLAEFIPVAKEIGMMAPISHWELTSACETFASWNLEQFHLYITISQVQFEDENFVEELRSLVDRLDLKAEMMVLKISENIISDFIESHAKKLEELSKLGFSICVDDYGKGASSLTQLKHYCITCLKIDDSFTRQIGENKEAESIIDAAIKMAHCLDLSAIAEGVQTDEQLTFLKIRGCDLAQGKYFSEALDADDFRKLVRRAS